MGFGSISVELDEKIDRRLKANERNVLHVLSLERKLSIRQGSALDKAQRKVIIPMISRPSLLSRRGSHTHTQTVLEREPRAVCAKAFCHPRGDAGHPFLSASHRRPQGSPTWWYRGCAASMLCQRCRWASLCYFHSITLYWEAINSECLVGSIRAICHAIRLSW